MANIVVHLKTVGKCTRAVVYTHKENVMSSFIFLGYIKRRSVHKFTQMYLGKFAFRYW